MATLESSDTPVSVDSFIHHALRVFVMAIQAIKPTQNADWAEGTPLYAGFPITTH